MRKRPKRFRKAFQPQFADLVRSGRKCQTIRPYPKRACDMPHPGDIIVPFEWEGTPYRSKQSLIFGKEGVIIRDIFSVVIDSEGIGGIKGSFFLLKESVAKADGFQSWAEMAAWFENTHGLPFKGILIRW